MSAQGGGALGGGEGCGGGGSGRYCPVIETLICHVVTPKALATPCSTADWSKSLALPKAVATALTVSDKTSEYS